MPRYLLVCLLPTLLPLAAQQNEATPYFIAETLAGTTPSGDGGPATNGLLLFPEGVIVDAQGAIYVADTGQHRVRRFTVGGVVTTIAGTGVAGNSGDGGPAVEARLDRPVGLALDAAGTQLFIADQGNHVVRVVNLQTGVIAVSAGTSGVSGFAGDGGPARSARLNRPTGVVFDERGNLIITDSGNHRVRRVQSGTIATLAGSGVAGNQGDGTPAALAWLNDPRAVAVGPDGAVYFADYGNRLIRRVLPSGLIQTVAGRGPLEGSGNTGEVGPALEALIDPAGLAIDAAGDIYVADPTRHRVRKILTRNGTIDYFTGTGGPGFAGDGGPAEVASLNTPVAVAVDGRGAVVIADRNNHRVRRIAGGLMATVAGRGHAGGDGGPAVAAQLTFPESVAGAADGTVYVADTANHCVRAISSAGRISTVAGTCGTQGLAGETGPATAARFNAPAGVAVAKNGAIYIADTGNDRIRRVEPNGTISTVVGGTGVRRPRGLSIDADDLYLYFTNDFDGTRISRHLLTQPGNFQNFAGGGTGRAGIEGDGGPASLALLNGPADVAADRAGNIWILDRGNDRVRRVAPNGIITTTQSVSGAVRMAVDDGGHVFVSQVTAQGEHRILRSANGTGAWSVVAGAGVAGLAGDGRLSTLARFDGPAGLASLPGGRVAVADRNNHRVRVLNRVAPQRLELVSGDRQSAVAGFPLAEPLRVRLSLPGGVPLPGVPVTFAVRTGEATLASAAPETDAEGIATALVQMGTKAGPVVVRAAFGDLAPVDFTLTALESAIPLVTGRPRIAPGGVIGVGNTQRLISPNALISIYGENFAPLGVGRRVRPEEFVNGRLPLELLGVCVSIGGVRAPVFDVFPNQLNVQVPTVASGNAAVRVTVNCGTPLEAVSDPETVTAASTSPEFLYLANSLDGRNPVAAVNAVSGVIAGPESIPGARRAAPGDVITVFATGFGATNPALASGEFPGGVARVTAPVVVQLGGRVLDAADVLYVGAVPFSVIYQLNLRVPPGVNGNAPLRITIGAQASPEGAYLAVQ